MAPRKKKSQEKKQAGIFKKAFLKMAGRIKKEDAVRLSRTFKKNFKKVKKKLEGHPRVGVFIRQCELLHDVIRDWIKGEYEMPWQAIGAMTAALLYVTNPLDIIPDFIPLVGFIDDIFVMTLCIKLVRAELRKYCDTKGIDKARYGLGEGAAA